MTLSNDAGYPDCEDCQTNVYVERAGNRDGDWVCRNCGRTFSASVTHGVRHPGTPSRMEEVR